MVTVSQISHFTGHTPSSSLGQIFVSKKKEISFWWVAVVTFLFPMKSIDRSQISVFLSHFIVTLKEIATPGVLWGLRGSQLGAGALMEGSNLKAATKQN